jgi:proteasome accessory factor B
MAAYKNRIERLDSLEGMIPFHALEDEYPAMGTLLKRMGDAYPNSKTRNAQCRAIQRDLAELVAADRIKAVNRGSKPLRYRRLREDVTADRSYARKAINNILQAESSGSSQLDAVYARMLEPEKHTGLDASKLRIIHDHPRLLPAPIRDGVLAAVLEALALSRSLQISYRNQNDKESKPLIHPQALLQRGSRLYLYALKNDEPEVRTYALHRITSCAPGSGAARKAENFDLDAAIRSGDADFSDGTTIELVFRARGYVAMLLYDSFLSADQTIKDEDEDSDFQLRITATVLNTGSLLRWLLGCGDNIEVLEPRHLRKVIAAQTAKAARIYRGKEEG